MNLSFMRTLGSARIVFFTRMERSKRAKCAEDLATQELTYLTAQITAKSTLDLHVRLLQLLRLTISPLTFQHAVSHVLFSSVPKERDHAANL